jgi:hypothetical protein
MDRKSKYIIVGLVLFIIFLIIGFILLTVLGIGAYFLFFTDGATGNVSLTDGTTDTGNDTIVNDGFGDLDTGNDTGTDTNTDTDNGTDGDTGGTDGDTDTDPVELTDFRIEDVVYFCPAEAPDGFEDGGAGFKIFNIKYTGADAFSYSGDIKVSVTFDGETDESEEFQADVSLERNEETTINLIDSYHAGGDRAFLYVNGTTGYMDIKVDFLDDNEYFIYSKSLSGNTC